ncbi:hypothetical protein [Dactylosporangium sp. CS-033363]|uniref:hypothetical protein n=1 Tax=Dactylosporangium sp. CS-033363 TaxID=3239935 RepID=UPI003D9396C8
MQLPERNRGPADYLRVARDPATGAADLLELSGSPYSFVRLAVAGRADAALPALRRVWAAGEYDAWDRNTLLRALAGHPNADRALLLEVRDEAARLLVAGLHRPYAAVLALATRPELTDAEVRALTNLPGASRRLRAGILRALETRQPQ